MKYLISIVTVLGLCFNLYAQKGEVTGTVTNEDGEEILGVNVGLKGTQLGSSTNEEGRFTIEDVPAGKYTLKASSVGYGAITKKIRVRPDQTVRTEIQLHRKEVELGSITVVGQRNYNTISTTALRMSASIDEVPQSIQVVTREIIENQVATNLREVGRNVSGVYNGNPFGGSTDRFLIRGFRQDVWLRNGFRTSGLRVQEMANIERVEILKGPASVLHGRVAPGGIVNIVTEKPTETPSYSAAVRGGSFGLIEPSIDISGPLNEEGTISYRLNALYSQKDGFREPFQKNFERLFVSPVFSFELSEDTDLTLGATYVDDQRPFDRGLVAVGDGVADIPVNRNLQSPGDFAESEEFYVNYEFEHRFNDNLKLRNRFHYFGQEYFNVENVPFGEADQYFDSAKEGEFARYIGSNDRLLREYSMQTELIADVRTNSIEHNILVGFDLNRDVVDRSFQSTNDAFAFGPDNIVDIYDPAHDFSTPSRSELDYVSVNVDNTTDAAGVFIQDQIDLTEKWKLLAGGRYDIVKQEDINLIDDTTTTQTDKAFSPRAGIVYQPDETLSLYTSYSRSFQPNSGKRVDGSIIDPERGNQFEVGVRKQLLNEQIRATLAAFNLTKTNISSPDPENPGYQLAIGEVRSRGLELDVKGQIAQGWSVTGSYALMDTEIIKDGDTEGNEFAGVPKHGASLWSNYTVVDGSLNGLELGAGIFYRGERQGNQANNYQLPPYTRIDAKISYSWSNFEFGINLKNITDTNNNYTAPGFGRVAIMPGPPFTMVGSVSVTL